MAKQIFEKADEKLVEKVISYTHKNYKFLAGKELEVSIKDNVVKVMHTKDGAPIFFSLNTFM